MENIESHEQFSSRIETAIPNDAEKIALIQEETWLATYPNEEYGVTEEDIKSRDFTSEAKIQQWRERFENPSDKASTFVAKEGENVLGFCSVAKGEDYNTIRALYVLPEAHGKGLGKALLAKAVEWLGKEKDIVLHVASYNEKAINFYKNFGFEMLRENDPDLVTELPSGGAIPGSEMILRFDK